MFVVIKQFRGAKPLGTPCTSMPSYLISPGSAFVLLSSYPLVWSFPGQPSLPHCFLQSSHLSPSFSPVQPLCFSLEHLVKCSSLHDRFRNLQPGLVCQHAKPPLIKVLAVLGISQIVTSYF